MTQPDILSDPSLQRLWDALPEARIAGGAVRDALCGAETADVDLATPLSPEQVMQRLRAAGIKVVPTGLPHGTVTAVVDGRGFEVTTLRRDVETDGRHAVVEFTDDWKLDAARRDFTINAMMLARDGTVFDYFGGRDDLAVGRVRFVGDPATRIAEDYLRILRFFRFHARFGRTPPEAVTLAALRNGVPGMARLSVERVWNELRRILEAPDPDGAIRLMRDLGVWQAAAPEADGAAQVARLPRDPVLRLSALIGSPDRAEAIAIRLKMSNQDRDRLVRLMATPDPDGSDDDLRRLLADHLPADLIDRAWLAGRPDVRQRLEAMRRPAFPLEGRDVLAAGLTAGPVVGGLLRDIRRWWMAGGCRAGRAACLTELAKRIESTKISGER